MHIDLNGKTALVTASSAGIGLAIAGGLAAAGAETIINGRSEASLERALKALRRDHPDARLRGIVADLSSADGCTRIAEAAPAVDILVNNVGMYGPNPFFDTDDALWNTYFQTNVMSGVRLSRSYLAGMMERGWGRIVFISSESALNIPPDMIHYGFSKTAQLAIARGLAKFAADSGVTVNSVLPGPTASEGFVSMLEEKARKEGKSTEQAGIEFVRQARPSSIIARPASVDEVASMVVYVCSPQASATTGAALRVDGGVVDTIA